MKTTLKDQLKELASLIVAGLTSVVIACLLLVWILPVFIIAALRLHI
jgi:hypothetical protein